MHVLKPGIANIPCLEKWLCQADADLGGSQGGDHMALLQLLWFHFHCWGSYCGVFLCKIKKILIENLTLVFSFWRIYFSRVKTASNFKSFNSKPSLSDLLPIYPLSIYHFYSALQICIQNERHSETEHKTQSALCCFSLPPPL